MLEQQPRHSQAIMKGRKRGCRGMWVKLEGLWKQGQLLVPALYSQGMVPFPLQISEFPSTQRRPG